MITLNKTSLKQLLSKKDRYRIDCKIELTIKMDGPQSKRRIDSNDFLDNLYW